MPDTAAPIGHNAGPTTRAEELLETFARAPEELDLDSAKAAVVLAKQCKLALDRFPDVRPVEHRLAPMKRSLEGARTALLERLAKYMDNGELERVDSDFGPVAFFKDSTGYDIADEAKLPDQFKKLVPDKDKIRAALKEGIVPPGIKRTKKHTLVVS